MRTSIVTSFAFLLVAAPSPARAAGDDALGYLGLAAGLDVGGAIVTIPLMAVALAREETVSDALWGTSLFFNGSTAIFGVLAESLAHLGDDQTLTNIIYGVGAGLLTIGITGVILAAICATHSRRDRHRRVHTIEPASALGVHDLRG